MKFLGRGKREPEPTTGEYQPDIQWVENVSGTKQSVGDDILPGQRKQVDVNPGTIARALIDRGDLRLADGPPPELGLRKSGAVEHGPGLVEMFQNGGTQYRTLDELVDSALEKRAVTQSELDNGICLNVPCPHCREFIEISVQRQK